jgi:drug/metabolite transporter (DMT)-like permease
VLAFWRDCFVVFGLVLAFTLFSQVRFRMGGPHWKFLAAYGLTLALFNSMWTFSVQFNGAAVATVLAYSSPALTAILSRSLFKEEINTVKMISIILSLFGTTLVSGALDPSVWKINPLGILFGLLTGFFYACYSLMGKASANRSIDPWTSMLYGFGNASLFLFLFNLVVNNLGGQSTFSNFLWLGTSLSGWMILFFLGIGPTIGGFGLYLVSLSYLSATVANLIATLEPALTAIWAYLLLREQMTPIQIIGSVLVIASVILLRLGERRVVIAILD